MDHRDPEQNAHVGAKERMCASVTRAHYSHRTSGDVMWAGTIIPSRSLFRLVIFPPPKHRAHDQGRGNRCCRGEGEGTGAAARRGIAGVFCAHLPCRSQVKWTILCWCTGESSRKYQVESTLRWIDPSWIDRKYFISACGLQNDCLIISLF